MAVLSQLMVALTCGVGFVVAVVAAAHDYRTRLLLNTHNALLAAVALIGFSVAAAVEGRWPPVGSLLAGTALFAGPWLVANLLSPNSIGFGDVKFAAALGLYLGWFDPFLAVTAIVVAGVAVLIGQLGGRLFGRFFRNDADADADADDVAPGMFAFGPYLAVGAIVTIIACSWARTIVRRRFGWSRPCDTRPSNRCGRAGCRTQTR